MSVESDFRKFIVTSKGFLLISAKSNNVYTSAGISTGIDLALAILEDIKGALFTHKVARGLVIVA